VAFACALAAAGGAQEGFHTEIRLAIDTTRIAADKVRRADEPRLEAALRARLAIFTPRGEGSVKVVSPSDVRITIPVDRVTPEQLAGLTRTGYLEIRHFEDLRTSSNPDGRYEINFLNIQGAKQQESQVRFYDRKANRLVPMRDYVAKCPLIVTSADVQPGGTTVVTGNLLMAVRVPFKSAATKRLEGYFKRPGRILGVILDGEPISITAIVRVEERRVRDPNAPPETKQQREERRRREKEDAEAVPQLDVTGGFGSAAEAGYLATVFNAGPLPLPVKVVDTRLVAPRE